MPQLIHREFEVSLPIERAWHHLAQVEQWPSWAPHISRVVLEPPGELGAHSSGVLHLRPGIRSTFKMTVFTPPHRWQWAGRFLGLSIFYDHQFSALANGGCRLTWIVDAEGFGTRSLGKIFAAIYNRNLNRAVPRLIEQMNN